MERRRRGRSVNNEPIDLYSLSLAYTTIPSDMIPASCTAAACVGLYV